MITVQQWLDNNGTYSDGLKLYEDFATHNKNLFRVLKRKKSPVNLQKLTYELKKLDAKPKKPKKVIVSKIDVAPTQIQVVQQTLQTFTRKQSVYFHQLPEILHPTLLEANSLFKEMCMLKVQLNNLHGNAVKQANALQVDIYNKQQKNALLWSKIDHYNQYGQLPEQPEDPFADLTPAQLLRKNASLDSSISQIKTRINHNKKELTKTTDQNQINILNRKIAKSEAKLLIKEEQLLNIKDLINGKD